MTIRKIGPRSIVWIKQGKDEPRPAVVLEVDAEDIWLIPGTTKLHHHTLGVLISHPHWHALTMGLSRTTLFRIREICIWRGSMRFDGRLCPDDPFKEMKLAYEQLWRAVLRPTETEAVIKGERLEEAT
jgi:hypothetical protein